MTRSGAEQTVENDAQLKEALAVLISSTRSKTRSLPLTEIAKWLEIAVAKLRSYSAVADRIGLSPKMLRQFSYVQRLSPAVQRLFENRKLDSVDAATHLAMLSERDQKQIARVLAAGEIDTIDLRAVVELRQRDNSGSIDALARRVADSKTKQQYVAEFVVRGNRTREQILRAFKKYIPSSEIVALELEGAIGRLLLTPKGKQALAQAARTLNTSLKQVIATILHS